VGVSDEQIRGAMRRLDAMDLRAEPSGAATTAALLSGALELTGPVAVILSGGNVDAARYTELVA
jgi:threonine dehydratase